MGLFDSLFGGGNKAEAPKVEKKAVPAAAAPAPVQAEAAGLNPEVIAAISASINCMMGDVDAEMAAVIAATIHHSRGGMAVRFKSTSKAWAATGRQKIMDGRQFA